MNLSNPWFLAALIAILGVFHLEMIAKLLNLARYGLPLPERLKGVFDEETVKKGAEYAGKSARLDLIQNAFFLAVLLGFWWAGGFAWLDRTTAAWGWGELWTQVAVIGVIVLVKSLLSLPFEAWDTFGVEAEFGFNRTTPGTFILDRVKGMLLMLVLGVPLLALIVWFFQTQPLAAVWAWLCVTGFSLLMTWLSPRLLMPLFLKFTPLGEGSLRTAILALAQRLKFPVADVSVVDGSRRSSKANAFFAGFGKTKRIALFDTLVEKHTEDELLAVLAHEIGHCKLRHVPVQITIGLAETGLMFGLLHLALQSPAFFQAFGVSGRPVGLGLVFFAFLYQPLGLLLGLVSSAVSRRHEFQADAFAADACTAPPLMTALKKLSTENLAHPQPHPLTVALHYSHPPLVERLAALEKRNASANVMPA
ncbi:MAG: M48 family metallopeptidase [Verrucomicrobiaceae bacterium]|nr:M48 family metallopeptidase [Verrucomicrobiaceae bacterium]